LYVAKSQDAKNPLKFGQQIGSSKIPENLGRDGLLVEPQSIWPRQRPVARFSISGREIQFRGARFCFHFAFNTNISGHNI